MDITQILTRRFPGKEWTLNGDAYEGLTWLSDGDVPTEEELTALWPEVEAEMAAEVQARLDAKASAVAKLEALGLTIEEVSAAFGVGVDK